MIARMLLSSFLGKVRAGRIDIFAKPASPNGH
jgi:hypothetical protein